MQTDEIDRVIAGLTEAEKRMLSCAYETVLMDRMKLRGKTKRLREKGLATPAWRGGDLLTVEGVAAFNRLKELETRDAG